MTSLVHVRFTSVDWRQVRFPKIAFVPFYHKLRKPRCYGPTVLSSALFEDSACVRKEWLTILFLQISLSVLMWPANDFPSDRSKLIFNSLHNVSKIASSRMGAAPSSWPLPVPKIFLSSIENKSGLVEICWRPHFFLSK
jgi:hypothetical protein